jgi:hypothetical protein
MPDPINLGGCDENLPLLPITRQFDFGQFVFLREEKPVTVGPKKPDDRIVIDPSGGKYQALHDWLEKYQMIEFKQPGIPPKPGWPPVDALGGVSIGKVLKVNPVPDETPLAIDIESDQLDDVLSNQKIEHGGETYELDIDGQALASLFTGSPALVVASATGNGGGWFVTQLRPNLFEKDLTAQEMDTVLAGGELRIQGQLERVELDRDTISALLEGQPVVARISGGEEDGIELVRLVPPETERQPATSSLTIPSLAEFLMNPSVPAAEGGTIPIRLAAADVHELREHGAVTVKAGDTPVTVHEGNGVAGASYAMRTGPELASRSTYARAEPWSEESVANRESTIDPAAFAGTGEATVDAVAAMVVESTLVTETGFQPFAAEGNGTTAAAMKTKSTSRYKSTAQAPKPLGIPIAVFMPWRQSWELTGFSRGELRHSLALAPQEETTIEVSSWERRLRSLDQSATTDIEQSFEFAQTERETDDVFQELTKRHDFSWQLEGSVDATYNAGTGSITVSAGGQVDNATQLQQIARNTQQRMKESTQKASAKIRSVRTTRITDTIESGRQDRITRVIRNPNLAHTLTLDFFETLCHYKVTLEPVPDRLGLVALLPNPMSTKEFTTALIRRNETALRRALLEPALVDGFEAARTITAYLEAKRILDDQAMLEKDTEDTKSKETTEDEKKEDAGKPTPQETEMLSLLAQISAAADKTEATDDVAAAMTAINLEKEVTEEMRRNAQYWLFRRLCAKYLPSLLDAMDKLPATSTVAQATAFVALIPPQGSAVTLANLNDKSDFDKEQAGLGPEIARYIGAAFKWGWSTGRCREEGLYTAHDAGLAGLVSRFERAYQAWETKRAEGDMAEAKDVAITKATAQQDKLTAEDKLAMAFPLDELSSAYEREQALRAHLNEHLDHYSFALFQALSPAEQNAYIEAQSNGALEVGMFEPRVVAINGADLAVPLSPPPDGPVRDMLEKLRESFEEAFEDTADEPDTFIFPTPGLTINSRLGKCTACEEFIEESRQIELRRLAAEADTAEQEVARRKARIEADDLDDPDVEVGPLHVRIDQPA